jgi:hypothetical protein
VLNFFLETSTTTITYRILNQHTLAVCIVELDDHNNSTVQIGNMCRINPDNYLHAYAKPRRSLSAPSSQEGDGE